MVIRRFLTEVVRELVVVANHVVRRARQHFGGHRHVPRPEPPKKRKTYGKTGWVLAAVLYTARGVTVYRFMGAYIANEKNPKKRKKFGGKTGWVLPAVLYTPRGVYNRLPFHGSYITKEKRVGRKVGVTRRGDNK